MSTQPFRLNLDIGRSVGCIISSEGGVIIDGVPMVLGWLVHPPTIRHFSKDELEVRFVVARGMWSKSIWGEAKK